MTIGNLVAVAQSNIKRMLGYSTIAHAGYILVGLAAVACVLIGEGSQRRAVREFVDHCRRRLGGMLKYYYRPAA